MTDYRNVWTIILAVGLLQVAGGVLTVIAPLGLEAMGLNALNIGLIASSYAGGFMVGAALAPAALRNFGNIRVFSAAAAANAASVLAMNLYPDPYAWTLLRVVQGAGFAWMLASAESWLASAVPAPKRGGVTGLYHLVAKSALMLGPFLAVGVSALEPRAYLWCGLFLALSLIPIALTQRGQPEAPDATPLSLVDLNRLAPAAVIGVFLSGVIVTGTLALLPVFAQYLPSTPGTGSVTAVAAVAMAIAQFGGLLSQWPAGRLSDRFDRRRVVAVMALISAGAAMALGLLAFQLPVNVSFALLMLWGAGSLSFYGLCVAHAIDRAPPRQIPQVMSGLLFVWAVGSVIGPPLSGLAIRLGAGPSGLFLLAGALALVLAGAMALRQAARREVARGEQEPWELTQPSSVAGPKIDPRTGLSGGGEGAID